MLEATMKELVSNTKEQIDGLRNDMAAEFVKRDDDIAKARTEGILARNASADALANLEKRLKNTEEYVSMQTDAIAAVILACGLREDGKFLKAAKQVEQEHAQLHKAIERAQQRGESLNNDAQSAAKATPAEPAEREAVRLSEASELLGGLRSKSLEELIARGAEGYKIGGKCYIYPDSIAKIKHFRRHRQHKGFISISQAAKRAGIPYAEARNRCREFGWPITKFGKGEFMTESDSARLLLKYKL